MLDPFDILGISPNSDWKTVKKAYKIMLNNTHPDKMGGNAKYFMMVHEAFSQLEKVYNEKRRFKDAPTEKHSYNSTPEYVQQSPVPEMKNFSNSKFNSYFETNRIGHSDYMNNGYGNNMCESLNYQEDMSDIMRKKVDIPKQQLVVYKEPESLTSSHLDQYYQLGVEKIDNFTCRQGTDVQQAFTERAELIDTVTRYRNLDDITASRGSQNFQLSESEKRRIQKEESNKARLEQYRMQRMRQHDQSLNDRYTELHRRLM